MNIEFIFSEFGSRSTANQPDSFTDEFRLDPTYSSVKRYFPEAKLTLYTDIKELAKNYSDVSLTEKTNSIAKYEINSMDGDKGKMLNLSF